VAFVCTILGSAAVYSTTSNTQAAPVLLNTCSRPDPEQKYCTMLSHRRISILRNITSAAIILIV